LSVSGETTPEPIRFAVALALAANAVQKRLAGRQTPLHGGAG